MKLGENGELNGAEPEPESYLFPRNANPNVQVTILLMSDLFISITANSYMNNFVV
jgi:hypothetical protein